MEFILIFLLIFSWASNSNLKKENNSLKNYINYLYQQISFLQQWQNQHPMQPAANTLQPQESIQQPVYQPMQQPQPEVIIQKETMTDQEKKNVTILVTGALFIVLSAIVFLMSAWYSISDPLKTLVLILLTVVFFGCSSIAKNKFKLEKTSLAFFYIAMAYIPICLFSISVFGLLGEYLSISGSGKYIYLTFAALLVAIIYYFTYKRSETEYLLNGSILAQLLSVILFALVLSDDVSVIVICLLLYNLLLIILTKLDIFQRLYRAIPFFMSALLLCVIGEHSGYTSVAIAILAVNFLILESRNSSKPTSYMFNIALMALGLYTINLYNEILTPDLFLFSILGYTLSIYILENILLYGRKKEAFKESVTFLTLLIVGLCHIASFSGDFALQPYVVSIIQLILLTYTYKKWNNTGRLTVSILIPIYLILTGLSFINASALSYQAYIVFAVLVFGIGELFRKRDELIRDSFFVISHLFIVSTYIFMLVTEMEFIEDVLSASLLLAVYLYSFMIEKKPGFKYMAYLASNYVLLTLFNTLVVDTDLLYTIPLITTLTITAIELIHPKLRDESSDPYLITAQAIAFIMIYFLGGNLSTILAITFAVLIIIYNLALNNTGLRNIIPLISIIPAAFFNSFDLMVSLTIMIMLTLCSTVLSAYRNQISAFTVFSGLYLMFTMGSLENTYLGLLLFSIWAVVHVISFTKESEKDFFLFLFYISLLLFYNNIVWDWQLTSVTAIGMLGYIIVATLSSRTIFKKYVKSIDTLEYFFFTLIYLFAFGMYTNESDGMVFGGLILAIIFASYMFGYGAIFMISIISLIINVFLLTREFWFSIPWWIYLLAIGTSLIMFAIRNEISSKKENRKIGKIISDLKTSIDEKAIEEEKEA